MKVSDLVSPEACPFGSQVAVFSPCLHMVVPQSECFCVLISFSYNNTSQIGLGPTLWPPFNIITSLKTHLLIYSHSDIGGLGLQPMNFRGHSSAHDSQQGRKGQGHRRVSACPLLSQWALGLLVSTAAVMNVLVWDEAE